MKYLYILALVFLISSCNNNYWKIKNFAYDYEKQGDTYHDFNKSQDLAFVSTSTGEELLKCYVFEKEDKNNILVILNSDESIYEVLIGHDNNWTDNNGIKTGDSMLKLFELMGDSLIVDQDEFGNESITIGKAKEYTYSISESHSIITCFTTEYFIVNKEPESYVLRKVDFLKRKDEYHICQISFRPTS